MLIAAARSLLLVVDMQQRLLPAIADSEAVVTECVWLVRAAQRLEVPVVATEQYPTGLGATIEALRTLLPDEAIASKTHFSCVAAGCLTGLPGGERPQVVVVGVEAHVCVLQTALQLRDQGRDVFVVAEGVGSRRTRDRDLAVERMRQDGVNIVTREMVAFEWLGKADTPLFKTFNQEFLK